MAKTKAWFEGELRRMLGFDEVISPDKNPRASSTQINFQTTVEEIARFALDSFPVSRPLELRQYLEQFLGQSREVEDLCNELSARRKGASGSTAATPQAGKHPPSVASDDFWGGGGGGARAEMAGASAHGSGRSAGTAGIGGATGPGRRGQQGGNSTQQTAAAGGGSARGKGKGKGKVYQKAAAEADFWGGGTTSGRSKPASPPSAAKPGGARGGTAPSVSGADAVAHGGSAESALAPAPTPAPGDVPKTARKGERVTTSGSSAGGFSGTVTKSAAVKQQQPVVAPAAATSNKNGGGRKAGGGGGAPRLPSGGAGAAATKDAVAAPAAPEWSGVTCLCMGKTHDVVTNCTSCGKIACVREGGFGCSFCLSALPSTGREPRRIGGSSGGGGGGGTVQGGGGEPQSAALKEALERKDRLLLFDRTSASRTRVLDDQGDYFTSHNWLSQGEREKGEADEKARRDDAASRRGARRQVKMSIDIMGRRVVETKAPEETLQGAGGGGGGGEASNGGVGSGDNAPNARGISLDFGSSSADGGGGGGENNAKDEEGAPRAGAGGQTQRVSLENTGLRGRAKEVYDVMRANLDKKSRRRPGGGGSVAGGAPRRAGVVAEKSRVSLWRVQHDVDSDDLLRQDPPGAGVGVGIGGGGVVGGASDGFDRFEPVDELACAR